MASANHVVVVSDSHLSARAPDAEENWSAVVDHVGLTRPDLVVHVGDLTLDGAHDAADLAYARSHLDRLSPVPWVAVPGNHDIGDNPAPGCDSDPSELVNETNVARWAEVVGPPHWSMDVGEWTLVGVNAQLFGSGLPAEDEQWAWLEGASTAAATSQVALVSHKPVWASEAELAAAPPIRFVPSAARTRLRRLFPHLTFVVSGHVHQSRSMHHDGASLVWAPTTWAVLPDSLQATIGTKRCGVVHVDFMDDGTARHRLVEPDGMRQLVVGVDTPLYYGH